LNRAHDRHNDVATARFPCVSLYVCAAAGDRSGGRLDYYPKYYLDYPNELIGRAHTTEENGKWGETKQRSENQVAFNSVLGPS
jgi:hypothetical protein